MVTAAASPEPKGRTVSYTHLTGGSSKMDYIYDASDSGHWYVTIHNELDQIDFKSHPKVSMEIEKFLTGSNAPDAYLRRCV